MARLGVPSHTFSTTPIDVDKDYHQASDEAETLNIKRLGKTGWFSPQNLYQTQINRRSMVSRPITQNMRPNENGKSNKRDTRWH